MVTPSAEHNIVIPDNLQELSEGAEIEIFLDGDVYSGIIHRKEIFSGKIGISLVLKEN